MLAGRAQAHFGVREAIVHVPVHGASVKHPHLAKDLIPVAELRANLAACLQRLDDDGRPLVITQRGRATAVLVTPETLDVIEEQRELMSKVLRGLREAEAGQFVDEDEMWAEVDATIQSAEVSGAREVDARRQG